MNQEEILGILTGKVANTALQVTPIIAVPNPPSAIPVGCGLFIKVNEKFYLISAGHLLTVEDRPNLVVPGNNNKMVLLNGSLITTFENQTSKNDIDFAILQFSDRQIKHIIDGHFAFINPQNIIVNHKVEQNGNYIISGYPISGVKKSAGKAEFTPIPVKFLTHPTAENKYDKYDFNPEHFILVNYRRKLAPFNSTKKQITKNLTGISGSGLWYVPNWKDAKNTVPKFYLVGVMTENYKDKGFLVALRIDFVTETMRHAFDITEFQETKFKLENTMKNIYVSEIQ